MVVAVGFVSFYLSQKIQKTCQCLKHEKIEYTYKHIIFSSWHVDIYNCVLKMRKRKSQHLKRRDHLNVGFVWFKFFSFHSYSDWLLAVGGCGAIIFRWFFFISIYIFSEVVLQLNRIVFYRKQKMEKPKNRRTNQKQFSFSILYFPQYQFHVVVAPFRFSHISSTTFQAIRIQIEFKYNSITIT